MLGVVGVDRPQHATVAAPLEHPQLRPADPRRRRPEHLVRSLQLQDPLALRQLLLEPVDAEQHGGPVLHHVVADLVAGLADALHQLGPLTRRLADEEEGGAGLVLGEEAEDVVGEGAGPVVDGQGDELLVGVHAVEDVGIHGFGDPRGEGWLPERDVGGEQEQGCGGGQPEGAGVAEAGAETGGESSAEALVASSGHVPKDGMGDRVGQFRGRGVVLGRRRGPATGAGDGRCGCEQGGREWARIRAT